MQLSVDRSIMASRPKTDIMTPRELCSTANPGLLGGGFEWTNPREWYKSASSKRLLGTFDMQNERHRNVEPVTCLDNRAGCFVSEYPMFHPGSVDAQGRTHQNEKNLPHYRSTVDALDTPSRSREMIINEKVSHSSTLDKPVSVIHLSEEILPKPHKEYKRNPLDIQSLRETEMVQDVKHSTVNNKQLNNSSGSIDDKKTTVRRPMCAKSSSPHHQLLYSERESNYSALRADTNCSRFSLAKSGHHAHNEGNCYNNSSASSQNSNWQNMMPLRRKRIVPIESPERFLELRLPQHKCLIEQDRQFRKTYGMRQKSHLQLKYIRHGREREAEKSGRPSLHSSGMSDYSHVSSKLSGYINCENDMLVLPPILNDELSLSEKDESLSQETQKTTMPSKDQIPTALINVPKSAPNGTHEVTHPDADNVVFGSVTEAMLTIDRCPRTFVAKMAPASATLPAGYSRYVNEEGELSQFPFKKTGSQRTAVISRHTHLENNAVFAPKRKQDHPSVVQLDLSNNVVPDRCLKESEGSECIPESNIEHSAQPLHTKLPDPEITIKQTQHRSVTAFKKVKKLEVFGEKKEHLNDTSTNHEIDPINENNEPTPYLPVCRRPVYKLDLNKKYTTDTDVVKSHPASSASNIKTSDTKLVAQMVSFNLPESEHQAFGRIETKRQASSMLKEDNDKRSTITQPYLACKTAELHNTEVPSSLDNAIRKALLTQGSADNICISKSDGAITSKEELTSLNTDMVDQAVPASHIVEDSEPFFGGQIHNSEEMFEDSIEPHRSSSGGVPSNSVSFCGSTDDINDSHIISSP